MKVRVRPPEVVQAGGSCSQQAAEPRLRAHSARVLFLTRRHVCGHPLCWPVGIPIIPDPWPHSMLDTALTRDNREHERRFPTSYRATLSRSDRFPASIGGSGGHYLRADSPVTAFEPACVLCRAHVKLTLFISSAPKFNGLGVFLCPSACLAALNTAHGCAFRVQSMPSPFGVDPHTVATRRRCAKHGPSWRVSTA